MWFKALSFEYQTPLSFHWILLSVSYLAIKSFSKRLSILLSFYFLYHLQSFAYCILFPNIPLVSFLILVLLLPTLNPFKLTSLYQPYQHSFNAINFHIARSVFHSPLRVMILELLNWKLQFSSPLISYQVLSFIVKQF